MGHVYTATIDWTCDGDFAGNTYSRGHRWRFDGGIDVEASASPSVVPLPHSREEAVDPEEAFVAAISSCHMLWFLDLARRAGIVVVAYSDEARGVMERVGRTEGGMVKMAITRVTLAPAITFEGSPPDQATLDRLHHEAHEACFIANSVTTEITVEARPA